MVEFVLRKSLQAANNSQELRRLGFHAFSELSLLVFTQHPPQTLRYTHTNANTFPQMQHI